YYPGGMRIFKNISDTILKFQQVVQLLRSSQLGNYLNLLVTSVDIPAICDIDDDGDKDVVSFGQFGKLIEYHRNYSVEYGYGCDSLPFILRNECWGNFYESSLSCQMTLFDTCAPNPFLGGPPEMAPTPSEYRAWFSAEAPGAQLINDGGERHTGSSVLALDLNGSNTKELLIGDVSCTHLSGLINGGAVPNTNTSMVSWDSLFPNYSVPVDISIFPGAYHLDMDNDGIRDLMAAPNYTVQSNNYDGNWYYKNTGTDITPIFTYQQRALFQNTMIEHGEGSVPVLFDHDGDGLKDLVIANAGIWDVAHYAYDRYVSQFRLYMNTGTANQPVFTLTDTNYQNLAAIHDTTNVLPAFGDLDGDGDEDMLLGDIAGRIHRCQNTAGSGNPALFIPQQMNMTDDVGAVIDVGTYSAPHLADMDRDGDLDLLIGRLNGRVAYYTNIGTPSVPNFKLITANFGNVNVCEWWAGVGYSIPTVYDFNGEYHLFVGSLQGKVFHYDSIDNNLAGNFNLRDSLPDVYNYFGTSSAPAVADINNDTLPEMLVGNFRGGLIMYTAIGVDTTTSIGTDDLLIGYSFSVYPNPATGLVRIKTDVPGKKSLILYSIDGRKIDEYGFSSLATDIDLSLLSSGVYLLRLQSLENTGLVKNVKLIKR
ncbi:MAG: T9SS type A sorting domain-containing protein, partial [Flavobacteriales bacterium]